MFPTLFDAKFSDDRVYRYSLTRRWNQDKPQVNFILLNPSTADAVNDDPTIRRCTGYADLWGYGGIIVTNLFAIRSPNPQFLKRVTDPVGPENDSYLLINALTCEKVVCAWGNHGSYRSRYREVVDLLLKFHIELSCIVLTLSGQPGHPLYLKGGLEPIAWTPS